MRQHNLYRQQCSIYLFLQVGGVNAIEFKHTVVMRDQIRDAGIMAERDRLFKMKIAGNILENTGDFIILFFIESDGFT